MNKIIDIIKDVIKKESESIYELINKINESYENAINLLNNCEGKIITTGIGKSGYIARKISSSLASIGMPSIFIHSVEALHGDLGILSKGDIVIAISKSGRGEVGQIVNHLKRLGIKIISITGDLNSPLAKSSDIILDASVKEEACGLDIIPTTSTTIALVIGDALTIALATLKGLTREEFAKFHPGGTIGKKFWLKVSDLMLTEKDNMLPITHCKSTLKEAILEMTAKRGITTIVDDNNKLIGVITDGDLRRLLEKKENIYNIPVTDIMNPDPKTISPDKLASEAARLLEHFKIMALIVINENNNPIGIIHLHDLMKAGVV